MRKLEFKQLKKNFIIPVLFVLIMWIVKLVEFSFNLISYSKSIQLNPDFTTAIMNRANLFFEEEEFDKALRDSDSFNTETYYNDLKPLSFNIKNAC